ncbi:MULTISPECIES: hypothetical protein [Saccharothrix]|uniref:hypothetical protein n=1 Tax=Saccharothrix TaxID=2071 RepID=UPI001300EAA3|nr:hypothetical protein [Saccharothrix sp. CB00851]
MAQVVMLMTFSIVVLALVQSGCHRVYREVIRRRQATTIRAAVEPAAVQARADQARCGQLEVRTSPTAEDAHGVAAHPFQPVVYLETDAATVFHVDPRVVDAYRRKMRRAPNRTRSPGRRETRTPATPFDSANAPRLDDLAAGDTP